MPKPRDQNVTRCEIHTICGTDHIMETKRTRRPRDTVHHSETWVPTVARLDIPRDSRIITTSRGASITH